MKLNGQTTNPVPASAKWAFTTRRVKRTDIASLSAGVENAVAGDLVLCEIVEVNQHKKVQLSDGRYSLSYRGDLFVACVGDRYAPDQYQGRAEITAEKADLMAGGGVVGTVEKAHGKMKAPTRLRPVGLLSDADGEIINISRYSLPFANIPEEITVIGVFGASMNAGKTTAAVSLAHGLSRAGYTVAGIKATGTGAFGDFNAFADAGIRVLDFTDAGMPSTYRMPLERIEQGFSTLVGAAAAAGAEIVVVEIADGVFQQETAAILEKSIIRDRLDGLMFAAPDALGSVGGVQVLGRYGLRPFAVSGMVTRSPLAVLEATEATGVAHITREDLCNPEAVMSVAAPILRNTATAGKIAA